jgi:thiol-disulfide isomerase/thioredoxin
MKPGLRTMAVLLFCGALVAATAKRAPNLQFKDLSGKTQKIADVRGSVAVINFWATWCAPCREELPLLSSLTQEYAAKNVRFIAISADEPKNRAKVEQFLSTNKLAMEIWVGADVDMIERAGLGNVLPATMIVDEQGEVVARVLGEAREQDIRSALDWLLSGRNGPAPQSITKRY